MPSAIEARDLAVRFRNEGGREVLAVTGASLSVDPGEVLVVKGRSGSGKSTLLAALGLLLVPTQGQVLIAGQSASDLGEAARSRLRAHAIGFVFQHYALIPQLTAVENVLVPGLACNSRVQRRTALEALDSVGLADRADFVVKRLSGGEQQRVALARATVNRPDIILADEPTGNLDRDSEESVMGLLKAYVDAGAAAVVVTHSDEVAQWGDRVVSLEAGAVQTEGAR